LIMFQTFVFRHISFFIYDLVGVIFVFFFFFQAEDGIRDGHVTGVQTCALPISPRSRADARSAPRCARRRMLRFRLQVAASARGRSEERRVGKECRSRWWLYH